MSDSSLSFSLSIEEVSQPGEPGLAGSFTRSLIAMKNKKDQEEVALVAPAKSRYSRNKSIPGDLVHHVCFLTTSPELRKKHNHEGDSSAYREEEEYDDEEEDEDVYIEEVAPEVKTRKRSFEQEKKSPAAKKKKGGGPASPREKQPENSEIDITKYLCMPQSDAAKRLGMPVSTLSKRWKRSVKNRKWPYRAVTKLDRLMRKLEESGRYEVSDQLDEMKKKRKELLAPVKLLIPKV